MCKVFTSLQFEKSDVEASCPIPRDLVKVPSSKAYGVKSAVLVLLRPLVSHVHTITSDNHKHGYTRHDIITEVFDADFYFEHPKPYGARGGKE